MSQVRAFRKDAAPADQREAAADQREDWADAREAIANERDRVAERREAIANERDRVAERREAAAAERNHMAERRDRMTDERELATLLREERWNKVQVEWALQAERMAGDADALAHFLERAAVSGDPARCLEIAAIEREHARIHRRNAVRLRNSGPRPVDLENLPELGLEDHPTAV